MVRQDNGTLKLTSGEELQPFLYGLGGQNLDIMEGALFHVYYCRNVVSTCD